MTVASSHEMYSKILKISFIFKSIEYYNNIHLQHTLYNIAYQHLLLSWDTKVNWSRQTISSYASPKRIKGLAL